MDDELRRVFSEVADLSPEERARYFDSRVVPEALRADVESLLRFDTQRRLPVSEAVAAFASTFGGDVPELGPGGRCGPFELVRLLGRGGMGAVFLARRTDGEVEQYVAIKFVLDMATSALFRDRFLQERQILASLTHPGITRLLDVGRTAGGHPYLVMEYVDGTPIDAYADKLTLRERLELFLRVCDAVSYAHRNLIIHRDLKPSNILVEAGGQPKLLDFGIARFIGSNRDQSVTRVQLLTPEYASPEQLRGSAYSTATDVYSLGAVLYRMLTGSSSRDPSDAEASMDREIGAGMPTAPSRVVPHLPRDLDFVVLKALREEPEERYPSVDALADDVRAFMEARPVRARSASVWYWTRTFFRRRWLPMSAVTAIIAALAAGLYVANRERRVAEDRFHQLRHLSARILAVDAAVRNLPGSTSARQQMVAASMEYLDGLGRETRHDRDLMFELASGYIALAQVQGVPTRPHLGQFAAATESLRKADVFLQQLLADDPDRPDLLAMGAELEQDAMIIADTEHHADVALDHTQRCADYLKKLFDGGRATRAQEKSAHATLANVSVSYTNRHHLDDAIAAARRMVERSRASGSESELAQGLSLLANALRLSGQVDAALPPILEARRLAENAASPNPMMKDLALYGVLLRQGQILGDEGISLNRPDEAIEPLQRAFDLMDQLAAQDPSDNTSRDRAATAGRELADILVGRDRRQALAVYDRALQREREQKPSARTRREEARLLARSSYPLRSLNRAREARERIDASFDLLKTVGDYPAATIDVGDIAATALRARADLEDGSGDSFGAAKTCRELLTAIAPSEPDAGHDLRSAVDRSNIDLTCARVLQHAGQKDEAAALFTRIDALWLAWDRQLPNNPVVLRHRQRAVGAAP
ncbi:MAG TPA: serine/threonine-protein kinase [Vicinamibacterales bacterium]|jgi:tRNA A-37 threonylcarbamoyl transferase component Bud32/tetratricopeptide (TPR) repeat protein